MVSVNFKVLWQPIQASQFCQKDRQILVKINYQFMIVVKIIHCNNNRLFNRILHPLRHRLTINKEEKEISHRLSILVVNPLDQV
jgi:hypothetical protein